jgi:hypothetical protein
MRFPKSGESRLFAYGVNAHLLIALAAALKFHDAVNKGEQRVVLTDADILTGMEFGTPLPYEYIARESKLPVGLLGAKPLGSAVTAVSGAADTFFMSEQLKFNEHFSFPPI